MSTATIEQPRPLQPERPVDEVVVVEPVVALKRRTIDSVLIGFGVVATAAFVVAGGLLMWGHNFSSDYVGDELASQNISFPSAADLTDEGRTDLLQYADQQVDSGNEAQAYASFINGHLQGVADGATYADLGAPESAAKAAVTAAVDAGQTEAQVAALQDEADVVSAQRNSLFKGETLRGLLLSAYAWSTVGSIAGIAAIGAFIAAALMAILVALGGVHLRRTPNTA
jgi:hypothetical protein